MKKYKGFCAVCGNDVSSDKKTGTCKECGYGYKHTGK